MRSEASLRRWRKAREATVEMGWTVLPHPPYGPNFSPSKLNWFCPLKDALRGIVAQIMKSWKTACLKGSDASAKSFMRPAYTAMSFMTRYSVPFMMLWLSYKCTLFPHKNVRKWTWRAPDWKSQCTYNVTLRRVRAMIVAGPVVAQRVDGGIALLFHDRGTRKRWVVSSTPRPHFNPGERPATHCTGGWVGPRASLNGWKISPHWDRIPVGRDSQSLYRLSYPAHGKAIPITHSKCAFVVLGIQHAMRICHSHPWPAQTTIFFHIIS